MLFGTIAWQDRLALVRDADDNVARGADSVREHALKVFQTDALVIALIEQRIRPMSWDEIATSRPLHEYLAELVGQNPELEGAFIADASGTVRNSSRFFPALASAVASRDFFTAAQAADKLAFGERLDESFPDRSLDPHFHVAKRRSTTAGRFDGLIALNLSSSYFPKVWSQSWHNSADVVTILMTTDFQAVAAEPSLNALTTPEHRINPNSVVGRAMSTHADAGLFRGVSPVDGIERIAAYRHVDPFDAYVLYGISFDSVLHTWYRHLLIYGGIFGLAALALGTISLIAARHIEGERIAIRELAAETDKRLITEKQLFKAEKLEAIGKVAGGFAHDFGNLLMAIGVNLDFARSRVTGEVEEALRAAQGEVDRGSEAVRSLMVFAREGSLSTQIVDAKARIGQMTGLLQQAIGGHSTLEITIDEGLWPIEINANQLELALLNLAVNSRDAMPNSGKVRVVARNISLTGAPDGLTGDFVEISVSDTGLGMPPEIASKIFEPFFTTKDEGKGTGLGLSQVYGLAKQSGGTATVTSAVGHGTTVAIYIPKCAAGMAPHTQRDATSPY